MQALVGGTTHLFFLLPLLLAVSYANVYVGVHPDMQWDMPVWLQLHWAALSWGTISGLLAYVFGFCSSAALAMANRGRTVAPVFGAAVLISIQCYAAWVSRPNLPPLADTRLSPDGVILQTSAYTCVPAAAANIAAILGIHTTEKELVALFHTTRDGTFPAQAIGGMKEIGIIGKKVDATNGIETVHTPAMLFISGDTHAVVYAKRVGDVLEIWNPNSGKALVPASRLGMIWHGHALEFQRAND